MYIMCLFYSLIGRVQIKFDDIPIFFELLATTK